MGKLAVGCQLHRSTISCIWFSVSGVAFDGSFTIRAAGDSFMTYGGLGRLDNLEEARVAGAASIFLRFFGLETEDAVLLWEDDVLASERSFSSSLFLDIFNCRSLS